MNVDKNFLEGIANIFNLEWTSALERQHDRYNFGCYSFYNVLKAIVNYYDPCYVLAYYCSDCSFPKFKDLKTGDIEACPECGD